MSLNKDNMLTIGSMVILKGTDRPVMIVGFYQVAGNKLFDYSGVLYPLGLANDKRYLYFNSEDIDKVVHNGFSNEKDKEFKEKFTEAVDKANKNGYLDIYEKD